MRASSGRGRLSEGRLDWTEARTSSEHRAAGRDPKCAKTCLRLQVRKREESMRWRVWKVEQDGEEEDVEQEMRGFQRT